MEVLEEVAEVIVGLVKNLNNEGHEYNRVSGAGRLFLPWEIWVRGLFTIPCYIVIGSVFFFFFVSSHSQSLFSAQLTPFYHGTVLGSA